MRPERTRPASGKVLSQRPCVVSTARWEPPYQSCFFHVRQALPRCQAWGQELCIQLVLREARGVWSQAPSCKPRRGLRRGKPKSLPRTQPRSLWLDTRLPSWIIFATGPPTLHLIPFLAREEGHAKTQEKTNTDGSEVPTGSRMSGAWSKTRSRISFWKDPAH